MTLWLALAGTFITALFALVGVLWTASQSRKAQEAQAEAQRELARTAPYDKLAERVAELEELPARVEKLEREQRTDRAYIRQLRNVVGQLAPELVPKLPPPPEWYSDGDSQSAI